MADFDPDAFLSEGAAPSTGGFDPDAFLAGSPASPAKEKTWWERGAVRPTTLTKGDVLKLGEAAAPSFREGFGDQPLGSMVKPDPDYPKTSAAWQLASVPVEIVGRTISGGVHTLGASAAGVHELLSGNPDEARRFGREVSGMAESRMFDVGQHIPKPHAAPRGVNVPEAPLEGEVLRPRPPGGGAGGIGREGPTIEGEWTSPMTPREGTNARLLPHDYEGSGIAGDPHFDAAWEQLGSRGSMGAAGRPGGPLADIHPEAIQIMRDIVREEGLSPWELERRQEEERSPHHFGGEWSDAMRNELRGLNSLGGEGANIIGQSVRARRRDAPERMRQHFGEFFGERLDPREEVAQRRQAEERAQPFWREFDQTPIPPTPELAALNDALHASGAWTGAERALRMERVPRENQFVELPNTGEYVLANPELPSETVRVPTARFYQAVKVRIDGMIDKAMAAPEGRDDARILVGLKKALTEVIDNHPDPTVAGLWKRSREMSAGQKQWESSIALGKRALSEHVDPGDFSMLWDTLSDQEKLGVRKGAGESLGSRLGRVGNADINTMRQVLGENNQQKLRIMQESEGAADRLISNIEHEHGMSQGPLTGPNTADKLAAQQRYRPKESWAQSAGAGDIPHGVKHGLAMGAKNLVARMQRKSIEEAQKKQNQINADVARLMTLQGPEWNAVVRYLHGVEPTEPSPGAGPRPSPRPAPARAAGEAESPPPSSVPEGPPGYPQPEMTAVEATKVLQDFGYDQPTINRMGGATRMATAQHLRDAYPGGPPAEKPEFPGEAVKDRWADKTTAQLEQLVRMSEGQKANLDHTLSDPLDVKRQPPDTIAHYRAQAESLGNAINELRVEIAKRGAANRPPISPESPLHPKGEKPMSLLEWIRKQGGISPNDPMIGDVRAMFGGKNPGGIIRQGGKRLDRLREGAVGEKYFLDQGDIAGREASTDVNTLLDAMLREADGEKQYPVGHEGAQVRNKDLEARNQEQKRDLEFSPEARRFDRELSQYGYARDMIPPDARVRAVEMLRSGIERDPVEAFEKAMNEKLQGDIEGERAAEVGEGLEPSPQSRGMAARGNRAAAEGQARTRADVRDTGELDRAEKEPLKRATGGRSSRKSEESYADWRERIGSANGGRVNRASGGRVDPSAINSNPTEAQKEAGNYAKDHVHIHGLDITIENAKGSKRSGIDKGGKPWSVALPAHYGYIKGSVGADNDHVDCYIGPHTKASKVYVVDQKDAQTGKFDEHKCFIGFASAQQARACYLKAFSDGKGRERLGAMHEADIDGFKTWIANGDTTKPIGKKAA